MTRKVFRVAGLAATLLAAPAFSHHSFSVFDQSKVLYMEGAVKQFELVNPHAWLHLNIVNDKGGVSTWSFEAGSPTQLVKLGWSKDTGGGPCYLPTRCEKSFSFSQIASISSSSGKRSKPARATVQGRVYAFGSSMVTSRSMCPKLRRR